MMLIIGPGIVLTIIPIDISEQKSYEHAKKNMTITIALYFLLKDGNTRKK